MSPRGALGADRPSFPRSLERESSVNIYALWAGMAVLVVVRIGVAYPVHTTLGLLLLAAVGIGLYWRRPHRLPPTRHARRMKLEDTLD
jgi:hypothetical protein